MKKQALWLLSTVIVILLSQQGQTQTNTWQWANSPAFEMTPYTQPEMSTDQAGNIYVAGSFMNGAVFPTSPSPTNLSNAGESDVFIAKYDPAGNVIWAVRAGGVKKEVATAIKQDGFGNIYVAGYFFETTTFENQTVSNPIPFSVNIFIAKYNGNGDLLWLRFGEGGDYYYKTAFDLAVDAAGDAYMTGMFGGIYSGSISFAPLPTITSSGWWDMFLIKYNGAGDPQWLTRAGSSEAGYDAECGNALAVDPSGNVYVTGNFNGSSTAPTYFGTIQLVSNGGGGFGECGYFLAKYSQSTSTWEWAVEGGGPNNDLGFNVSLDAASNVYVSGIFDNNASFGPYNFTSTGLNDYFIARYSSSGTLDWIKQVEGVGGTGGHSSEVDAAGNFYFTGTYSGTATVGTETFTSLGYNNWYISRWSSNGDFQWVKPVPGNYYSQVRDIEVESNGNVEIASIFAGAQWFDATQVNSTGFFGLAIAKMNTCSNVAPVMTCPGDITVAPSTLAGTVVVYSAPSGTSNSGNVTITQTGGQASGALFPIGTTTNSFQAVDACGNISTCSFTVIVENPYCTTNSSQPKVYVCHDGNTICISVNALATHLGHGDYLGACSSNRIAQKQPMTEINEKTFNLNIFPNPTASSFNIRMESGNPDHRGQLKITNASGQLIETRSLISEQVIKVGENYKPGLYFVELVQGNERKTMKLVKLAN